MLIDGSFEVAAPPAEVLEHLFDARLMASCLPGCESLEAIDADRYRAVIAMALAAIGLQTNFAKLVRAGARPLALGFILWIVVAVTSLVTQHLTGEPNPDLGRTLPACGARPGSNERAKQSHGDVYQMCVSRGRSECSRAADACIRANR